MKLNNDFSRKLNEGLSLSLATLWPSLVRIHTAAGDAHNQEARIVFILSFPRSGTTMFGSILQNLSERGVHYYGELLGGYSSSPEIANISRKYRMFGFRYLKFFFKQRRHGLAIPYAMDAAGIDARRVLLAMKATAGVHVVKIFDQHVRLETLESLLTEFRPLVIFIRRNHRERYLSLMRARSSGKWARQRYGDQEIEVSSNDLIEFQKNTERWYVQVKGIICRLGLDFDDVSYRDLLNQDHRRVTVSRIIGNSGNRLSDEVLYPTTTKQGSDQASSDFEFESFSCCEHHSTKS